MRGLKPYRGYRMSAWPRVAPLMGAWIETIVEISDPTTRESHLSWVRGLKHRSGADVEITDWSHLSWVRGLKHLSPATF